VISFTHGQLFVGLSMPRRLTEPALVREIDRAD
jgi:hypothetical protein